MTRNTPSLEATVRVLVALHITGAVASMALAGVWSMPDAVMAPMTLAAITAGALLHERRLTGRPAPRLARAPALAAALLLAGAALLPGAAMAADDGGPTLTLRPTDSTTGVEASVLWPIFPGHLFQLRAHLATPAQGGGLLLGAQGHVPHFRETEGTFQHLDAQLGWRQDIGRLYVLVQPAGLAAVVYRSNPWPIQGEGVRTTEPPIYMGNVSLGLRL